MTKGAERSGAWPGRRSGAGGLAGFGGEGLGDLRLPDPDKDRHCAAGRRPPRPGPVRPNTLGARTVKPDGIAPRDKQAEGLPWRTDGEGGVAVFTDTRPLTAGRPAAVLHVAAGSYGGARDDGSLSFEVERGVHFWGGGPRKCGVLRRARAGDGPGAKLLSCRHAARAGMTVVRRTDGAA